MASSECSRCPPGLRRRARARRAAPRPAPAAASPAAASDPRRGCRWRRTMAGHRRLDVGSSRHVCVARSAGSSEGTPPRWTRSVITVAHAGGERAQPGARGFAGGRPAQVEADVARRDVIGQLLVGLEVAGEDDAIGEAVRGDVGVRVVVRGGAAGEQQPRRRRMRQRRRGTPPAPAESASPASARRTRRTARPRPRCRTARESPPAPAVRLRPAPRAPWPSRIDTSWLSGVRAWEFGPWELGVDLEVGALSRVGS